MGSILAKVMYQNEQLVFNSSAPQSGITSEQINNKPQQCWLVRNPYGFGGNEAWQLEFVQPTSFINVLTGVWIQQGQQGFVIDGNVADVVAKLNGCCGTNAVVVQNYAAGLPAYQAPVPKTYTLVHADDGTVMAINDAELLYLIYIIPSTFTIVSHNSGATPPNSTYTFQSYDDPIPKGTDTITETARVFTSNEYATALSGSNVYLLTGICDGQAISMKGTAQTFASLVTNLQADPVFGLMGTWSTASTHITLTTSVRDAATLVLAQAAP
jgi:hypothetical protein